MAVATPTSTDLRVLQRAYKKLGLEWTEIAQIIGVDESTLHRWKSHTSKPHPMARSRIAQFQELMDLLAQTFSGPDLARTWLREKKPESLGGKLTPLDVMRTGRLDRIVTLLHFVARGA